MVLYFVQLLFWPQPAPTPMAGGDDGGASASSASADPNACMLQAGMMAALMVFFYFFMIRPEQKRREESEAALKSLRKGMKVRTTSGILGEIISLTDHEVVLGVADKVRINVLRSHIQGPEPEKREPDAKDDKKPEAKKAEEGKDDKSAKRGEEARS